MRKEIITSYINNNYYYFIFTSISIKYIYSHSSLRDIVYQLLLDRLISQLLHVLGQNLFAYVFAYYDIYKKKNTSCSWHAQHAGKHLHERVIPQQLIKHSNPAREKNMNIRNFHAHAIIYMLCTY